MFMYTSHRFINTKREGFLELTVGPADSIVRVPVYINHLAAIIESPFYATLQILETFLTNYLRYLSSSPNGQLVKMLVIIINAQHALNNTAIWAEYVEESILKHLPGGTVGLDICIERHSEYPDIIIQYRRDHFSTPWSKGKRKVMLYMLLNNPPKNSSYNNVQWPEHLGAIDVVYLGADYTSTLKPINVPGILGNQRPADFPLLKQRNIKSLEIEVNSLSFDSLLEILKATFRTSSNHIKSLLLRVDPNAGVFYLKLEESYKVTEFLKGVKGLKKLGVSYRLLNNFLLLTLVQLPELEELEILDFCAEPNEVTDLVDLWSSASPVSLEIKLKKIHVGTIIVPEQAGGMVALLGIFGK